MFARGRTTTLHLKSNLQKFYGSKKESKEGSKEDS
jgi:hypothetical protein